MLTVATKAKSAQIRPGIAGSEMCGIVTLETPLMTVSWFGTKREQKDNKQENHQYDWRSGSHI